MFKRQKLRQLLNGSASHCVIFPWILPPSKKSGRGWRGDVRNRNSRPSKSTEAGSSLQSTQCHHQQSFASQWPNEAEVENVKITEGKRFLKKRSTIFLPKLQTFNTEWRSRSWSSVDSCSQESSCCQCASSVDHVFQYFWLTSIIFNQLSPIYPIWVKNWFEYDQLTIGKCIIMMLSTGILVNGITTLWWSGWLWTPIIDSHILWASSWGVTHCSWGNTLLQVELGLRWTLWNLKMLNPHPTRVVVNRSAPLWRGI